MSRTIVTTSYRYKRPPRKRKAVALEVPAAVAAGPEAAPRPTIVTTVSRKRAARTREDGPQDPEAADAMRAWLEKAKWGRGPPG